MKIVNFCTTLILCLCITNFSYSQKNLKIGIDVPLREDSSHFVIIFNDHQYFNGNLMGNAILPYAKMINIPYSKDDIKNGKIISFDVDTKYRVSIPLSALNLKNRLMKVSFNYSKRDFYFTMLKSK